MAFYDNTTNGPGLLSSAQAITTTAASTNIYDVTGAGSGNAPSMSFGNAAATAKGFDIGSGDSNNRPTAYISVGVDGTGAGTITFQVQAAPDNGSNAPGTYVTLSASEAYVGTTLDAGEVITLPVPPVPSVSSFIPRFYRINYVVSGSATATVTAFIGMNLPSLAQASQYASNFEVVTG